MHKSQIRRCACCILGSVRHILLPTHACHISGSGYLFRCNRYIPLLAALAYLKKMTTMTSTTTMMDKGHKHYKPIEEFSNNFAIDRKIKEACIGLKPCTQHLLMELPTDEDRELIATYIIE
jgi:hypothetical protein